MKESSPAPRGGALRALRLRNKDLILHSLASAGPQSQAELAQHTGLSEGTISNLVSLLAKAGDVSVEPARRNGRRAHLVRLTGAASGLYVGVELGRNVIRAIAFTGEGSVKDRQIVDRSPQMDYVYGAATIAGLVDKIIVRLQVRPDALLGIGVALCAPVDRATGALPLTFTGLPFLNSSWAGADLGAELEARFGVPALVLNNADSAVLAESTWGVGAEEADILYVQLSEGVARAVSPARSDTCPLTRSGRCASVANVAALTRSWARRRSSPR
jgi:DNA-binding MarR family transcriptional regulator